MIHCSWDNSVSSELILLVLFMYLNAMFTSQLLWTDSFSFIHVFECNVYESACELILLVLFMYLNAMFTDQLLWTDSFSL